MLTLAMVLYFTLPVAHSLVSPLFPSFDIDGNISPPISRGGNSCPRNRLEIIWACLATILASSWVSVHPNMPHPDDSKITRIVRRMELMFWAIITPEFVIYWAMRQWYGARKMKREFSGAV